ncbi:hypothetical protein RSOLAG22IIIB_12003 [Rhizoctonia solani]|uniref:Uncharacterized protein n=1 Tax=Rhizoctonia solani TaxID=456999 RepID=A0A0K6GBQ7_9AGAM|nr:unnamed protein product [Rhizoctonia solani]CUA75814.1 hypothetical protein RSOLAG22IIIB_12003 [Rhizoctonia solani]
MPCHQMLTVMGPDPNDHYLLTSDTSVTYKIARRGLKETEVLRNEELVATIRRGWFGRVGITMSRDDPDNSGAPPRMGWGLSPGRTSPRVEWRGWEYLHAVHIKEDRVLATYDPREVAFELKGTLGLENEYDVDIINELVATLAIYKCNAGGARPTKPGTKVDLPTRSNDSNEELATLSQDDPKAVKTTGVTTHTLTLRTGGVTVAGSAPLMDGAVAVTAPDGSLAPQKSAATYQNDSQIDMKAIMAQSDLV